MLIPNCGNSPFFTKNLMAFSRLIWKNLSNARLATLNSLDSYGRSPLFWAALRGDETSVKSLLRAGADISSLDREKRSALQSAIISGNVRCIELLCQRPSWRHCHPDCCMGQRLFTHVRDTLPARSALEDQNKNGVTALQCAVDLNHHRNVAYLLEIGANLESRDKDEDSPLFDAIRYCNIESLEVLLRYKSRFGYTNKTGQTALHVAAMGGDLRGLQLLTTASMEALDPRVWDSKGRTILGTLTDRVSPPDDFRAALEQLLIHLLGEDREDGDSGGDLFVDALEDPPPEKGSFGGFPSSTLPFHRNKCLIRIALPHRNYSPVANFC